MLSARTKAIFRAVGLRFHWPAKLLHESDIVQDANAVRAANVIYYLAPECSIAGAENIGTACNSGLQNGVVVRIAYHCRKRGRHFNQNAGCLQESKVPLDGF